MAGDGKLVGMEMGFKMGCDGDGGISVMEMGFKMGCNGGWGYVGNGDGV